MPVRTSVIVGGLLLAVILLAGCGSVNNTQKPKPTLIPKLEADGPPCEFVYWIPFHNIRTTCIEVVYNDVVTPEAAPELSGLAVGPDDELYMVRTAYGEIWTMRDNDGDAFLDDPFQVADGLNLPTGITMYEGALYVTTLDGVIRLDDADGDHIFETHTHLIDMTDDFWPGSIGVGPDGRLYVSVSAGCRTCEQAQQGALFSYTRDGNDARLEATGLRSAADFGWHPVSGELWILDGGRVAQPGALDGPPDELNRVESGADYGFPYCYGPQLTDTAFSPPEDDFCASTESPQVTFSYQSNPTGMVFYANNDYPFFENDLIVVLRGSWSLPEPAGYALVEVEFENAAPTGDITLIAPAHPSSGERISLAQYSLSGKGFFPFHPVDVVVDSRGWLYVSLEEGRIYRFRPRPAALQDD